MTANTSVMKFSRLLAPIAGINLAIIMAAIASASRSAKAAPDDDIHISIEAELFAQTKYRKLKRHKALAVGPLGRYGYGWNYPSAKQAEKTALEFCRKSLNATGLSQAQRKCVLYDVDGKLTGRGKPQGVSFDLKLTEPDPTYQGGRKVHPDGEAVGTIIFLHGCSGLLEGGWQYSWESFYSAGGYRVISPDSFADSRDPSFCSTKDKWPTIEEDYRRSRNLKFRIAQTRRTIELVRRIFPKQPIYIHGHSEGGLVAQLLNESVGGIIVTGASCGLWDSRISRTTAKVPTLLIVGTKDPFVLAAETAKSLSRHCKGVTGAGPMTVVSVEGMGHYAAVWWPKVAQAVGKFLKIKPVTIADSTETPKDLPPIPVDYYKTPDQKAFAAASDRVWSYSGDHDTQYAAEQAALFGCDEQLRWNPFKESSKQHRCVVMNTTSPKPGSTAVSNQK